MNKIRKEFTVALYKSKNLQKDKKKKNRHTVNRTWEEKYKTNMKLVMHENQLYSVINYLTNYGYFIRL